MIKRLTLLLFLGLAFGQKNENSTVGVGLVLYNGDKTELVNIGAVSYTHLRAHET